MLAGALSGLVAIVFAVIAVARVTNAAAARAFIATAPGAIWSVFVLWVLFGPWTARIDPTPVGWLLHIDLMLTIVLWPVWFFIWCVGKQHHEKA
jgi:hypothetical protein